MPWAMRVKSAVDVWPDNRHVHVCAPGGALASRAGAECGCDAFGRTTGMRMCAHLPEYQYQGWTLPLPFALFVFGLLLGQAGMLAGDPGIGVNWSSAAVMNGAEVNRSLSGALAVASTISDETLEHPSDWLPGASLPPRDGVRSAMAAPDGAKDGSLASRRRRRSHETMQAALPDST